SEIVERVEDPVAVAAVVRRRAHAIEDQRIFAVAVGLNVEMMTRRIHALVRRATLVELVEQRTKPVRMLVINSNWTVELGHLIYFPFSRVEQAVQACIQICLSPCHPERSRVSAQLMHGESKDPENADPSITVSGSSPHTVKKQSFKKST